MQDLWFLLPSYFPGTPNANDILDVSAMSGDGSFWWGVFLLLVASPFLAFRNFNRHSDILDTNDPIIFS